MSNLVMSIDHKLIRELMENDLEFSVEVKKGILHSALKHETGNILRSMQADELKRLIKEEVGELVGSWSGEDVNISPKLVSSINEKLSSQVNKVSEKLAEDFANKFGLDIEAIARRKVKYFLTEKVEKEMQRAITEKMGEVMDKLIADTINNIFNKGE